ncbi:MAG: substrate-binding domain-containing protein [Gammaproteobacteria bacterium]|nr:substrate-binding domain-containing protein [Gammaproteobacteria bacterium]
MGTASLTWYSKNLTKPFTGFARPLANVLFIAAAMFPGIPGYADNTTLRLATTTSVDNSGLLPTLIPEFERESGYQVHVIAVGTGKAIQLLRNGDVDVVIVHAREQEDKLIADGYGVDRHDVMHNDFIIVGPMNDPAGIAGLTAAVDALQRIADSQSLFVSRGDESGTHAREKQLWGLAQINPAGTWYRATGQGMGETLQIAGELDAYTLVDRGTWLAYRQKSPLTVVVQGDERLLNYYGIIAGNPAKYPDINYQGATRLIQWITSAPAQRLIGNFTIDGEPLFVPELISR